MAGDGNSQLTARNNSDMLCMIPQERKPLQDKGMVIKMKMDERNLSMLCDFYELTMSNGYFKNGFYKKTAYFDVFFRSVPDNGGFAIAAGLSQIIEYIENLHFSEEDIA